MIETITTKTFFQNLKRIKKMTSLTVHRCTASMKSARRISMADFAAQVSANNTLYVALSYSLVLVTLFPFWLVWAEN